MLTPLPGAWEPKPGSATLPFFGVQPVLLDEKVNRPNFLFTPNYAHQVLYETSENVAICAAHVMQQTTLPFFRVPPVLLDEKLNRPNSILCSPGSPGHFRTCVHLRSTCLATDHPALLWSAACPPGQEGISCCHDVLHYGHRSNGSEVAVPLLLEDLRASHLPGLHNSILCLPDSVQHLRDSAHLRSTCLATHNC